MVRQCLEGQVRIQERVEWIPPFFVANHTKMIGEYAWPKDAPCLPNYVIVTHFLPSQEETVGDPILAWRLEQETHYFLRSLRQRRDDQDCALEFDRSTPYNHVRGVNDR